MAKGKLESNILEDLIHARLLQISLDFMHQYPFVKLVNVEQIVLGEEQKHWWFLIVHQKIVQ